MKRLNEWAFLCSDFDLKYFSLCLIQWLLLLQEINVMMDLLCFISVFKKCCRLTELRVQCPLTKNNHTIKQNNKNQTKKDFDLAQERPLWMFGLLCFHLPLWLWKGYWKECQLCWSFWKMASSSMRYLKLPIPNLRKSSRRSNEIAFSY